MKKRRRTKHAVYNFFFSQVHSDFFSVTILIYGNGNSKEQKKRKKKETSEIKKKEEEEEEGDEWGSQKGW